MAGDLAELRCHGYELAAAVLGDDAEPLPAAGRPRRLAVLFGNEAVGLSAADVAACDRRVTLPMRRGTDSLNVAVAAGIFLYHFATAGAAVKRVDDPRILANLRETHTSKSGDECCQSPRRSLTSLSLLSRGLARIRGQILRDRTRR